MLVVGKYVEVFKHGMACRYICIPIQYAFIASLTLGMFGISVLILLQFVDWPTSARQQVYVFLGLLD